MKQKLILLAVFLTAFSAFSQTQYLTWATNDNNTITITGYQSTPTSLTIPDTIEDLPVTTIADKAFWFCTLTSITIPDSVTTIGDAFYECTSLTGIEVNEGNSLYSSLDGVLFNEDQTILSAYPGGKTGSYTIPDGVTTIEDWSFETCIGLPRLTIPDSVTSIGGDAFYACRSLTWIEVNEGNALYSSLEGVLFNKDQTILTVCPAGKTGSYAIPNGVTGIGYSAFQTCSGLISVTIPDSVTTLEDYVFYECTSLTGAYFLGNAPSYGTDVFYSDNLTTVYRLTEAVDWPTVPDLWAGRPTALWVPYLLTINGGRGSGSYSDGQQVAIAASNAPSGKVFDQWTGDTQVVNNVNFTNALVTMSTNAVTLTATYKDAAVYYTLTANGGIGGTVSPASTNVSFGDSANFVITASNYYRIATLTTNGTAVTGMSFGNNSTTTNFIWSNVQTSGVLAATFTAQVTTTAPADVPYEWLAQYGLTNYNTDADLDQDMDGLKTWQEYIAGTDPTNGTSVLKAAQNTRDTVSWSPVSGRVYSVYWSTNLMNGFQPLETNILYPQGSYTNVNPDSRINHYQIKVRME
ncbi:MAG: leucine-rich repeat protein [Kiritimatiellales bacterium]